MKVILFSFLLFGLAWADLNCECGKRNAGRIIGGKETKKNEYPWIVAFQTRTSTFTYCGGAIVTPWHVVTAAHCIWGKVANDMVLIAGAHDVNNLSDGTSQKLYVDEIIMHPNYNNYTLIHDLAVLVTSTEIAFNQYVGPVCMPTGMIGDELKGQMVKAMGWGRYVANKANFDKIKTLREVDIEVMSVMTCNSYDGRRICTYTPKKDTCRGDSGGPLIWLDPDVNRYIFVAVVSYGPAECGNSDGRPGVNTNVSYYLQWINDMILRSKSTAKTCHRL